MGSGLVLPHVGALNGWIALRTRSLVAVGISHGADGLVRDQGVSGELAPGRIGLTAGTATRLPASAR